MLQDFAKADQDWLDDLLRGISDGAPHLAADDGGKFMNAVALRVAPPRSSTSKPKRDAAKPAPEPDPAPEPKSKMQQLLDKFR